MYYIVWEQQSLQSQPQHYTSVDKLRERTTHSFCYHNSTLLHHLIHSDDKLRIGGVPAYNPCRSKFRPVVELSKDQHKGSEMGGCNVPRKEVEAILHP
mmetsp:Transcript_17645/g.31861  ORF Transcript_17645/g.31861 Transcript_17645/m.31861 type:complete len:98 (-) Transcript_17645:286-579(-)